MLGDVIELCVIVKDIEAAIERYTSLFGLKVARREVHEDFGYINAILPLGRGHIELLQPTDPDKAAGKYLEKRGEGVYLVGFGVKDVPAAVQELKTKGVRITHRAPDAPIAWMHPSEAHGLFVELLKRED